jgi:hypothetical protein
LGYPSRAAEGIRKDQTRAFAESGLTGESEEGHRQQRTTYRRGSGVAALLKSRSFPIAKSSLLQQTNVCRFLPPGSFPFKRGNEIFLLLFIVLSDVHLIPRDSFNFGLLV